MAEQLPRPEEVAGALATFPPKLSVLQRFVAFPEFTFESQVKSVTGVELPPGPNRVLLQFMESFEASMAGVTPPAGLPFPFPRAGGGGAQAVGETTTEATLTPRRFEIR
jgi:hypothetical protein